MNLIVSLTAALGLVMVFNGITVPSKPRRESSVPLMRLIREAGWTRVSPVGLLTLCAALAWSLALAALTLTGNPLIACAALIAGAGAPISTARRRRDRRRRSIAQIWPDALASVISGIRAGMSLAECCRALAVSGPQELREPFRSFAITYEATGSFEAGLERVRDELQEPVADRVVAVLLMTHQVGGSDLVRVLRATGEMLREDGRIRAEVHARWSWTIAAARVAACAPFIVLFLMSLRPEGAAAYTSPAGVTTVGLGSVATWVGYRLMLRAGRLPEEKRLAG